MKKEKLMTKKFHEDIDDVEIKILREAIEEIESNRDDDDLTDYQELQMMTFLRAFREALESRLSA